MAPSSLFRAVKHGDLLRARQLLDAGADPNVSADAVLCLAAGRGDVPMCRLLVERGAAVDGNPVGGWTPLAVAALADHAEALRFLLSEGASPDVRPQGYPLLNWLDWSAPRNAQREQVVQFLREAGARKHPQWWLDFRWDLAYRWTRALRRLGIWKPIRQPPGPPPIPLPSARTDETDP
jgi:ankyrin repeat protein